MKKTNILILLATMSAINSFSQELKEKDVPANLKDAFAKAYPNTKAEWEKEGNHFEAEFEVKQQDISVLFDANGNILETETEIPEGELPAAARDYISKNYKNPRIKEAAKITASDGKISYEADIDKKDLLFDSSGKFIKIEEEEKEKDDDK